MYKSRPFAFLMGLVVVMLAIAAPPEGAQAQQDGLGIAAVVNDDVISALDLHTRTTMIIETSSMQNVPETRARILPQVLRGLIDEKLMLQEARRSNISVSQSEIDAGLKNIADNNSISVLQLTEKMQQIGVPITTLTARIEAEIAWQLFVARTLTRNIKISEEEINDEIKRIEASAGKPEYLLAEIFLPVNSPDQTAEVEQLAARLMEQLQAGTPFSALATNFSRAPSAAAGGDMGWVQPSHLDADLLNLVSKMQPGNATSPVRTLGGYYIILLRDVRTSPGLGNADATMKLSQLHLLPGADGSIVNLGPKLQSMTQGMTSCAQLNALGKQAGSPLSGSMGEVSLSVLPPDMRAVLQNLPVGKPSTPIATGGGAAVLMVCERQDLGVDMQTIRTEISNRLTLERLDVAAQRHLRDLRRDAFVDIRL